MQMILNIYLCNRSTVPLPVWFSVCDRHKAYPAARRLRAGHGVALIERRRRPLF